MSEAKFTKGPWAAGRDDVASIVDGVDSKWIYSQDDYVAIASGRVIGSWDTVMANAHLIAAAPELYEACREASIMLKHLNVTGSLVDQIDSALAKARGETL